VAVLVEGLIIGLLGAIIAALIVMISYSWLLQYIMSNPMTFVPVVAASVLYQLYWGYAAYRMAMALWPVLYRLEDSSNS
jgi:cell division protein FtsX